MGKKSIDKHEKLYREYKKELKDFPHKTFTGFRDFSKDLAIEAAKAERQGYRCVVEVTESTGVCAAGYKK